MVPLSKICMQRLLRILLLALFLNISLIVFSAQDTQSSIAQIAAVQVISGALDAVDFSPDSQLIASGGRDNLVRLWDTATGENELILSGHSDWVTSLAFSPDGQILASGSKDNTIRLWDVSTGQSLRTFKRHQDDVTSLTFTHDGLVLISGSRDGMIRLEETETGIEILQLENYSGSVWDIALSPDGTILAAAGETGAIWLWGLWDESGLWIAPLYGHESPVVSIAFSPDGNRLLSGGQDGLLRLWEITNGGNSTMIEPTLLQGHIAPVMGVGFTADALVAISSSLDGTVRLWDVDGSVELGRELSTISGTGIPLTNLALNPDGTIAASVGTDGMLGIWNVDESTVAELIDTNRPAVVVNNSPRSPQTPNNVPSNSHAQTQITSGGRTLSIPSANINIGIKTFYLDGVSWGIDPWEPQVGHLQGTSWVDNVGNVALGAHSQYPDGRSGVFQNLYNVTVGDEVTVTDNGALHRYVVTDIRIVPYDDISVVYPTAHSRLTLITCDIPSFEAQSGLYAERLVVVADKIN